MCKNCHKHASTVQIIKNFFGSPIATGDRLFEILKPPLEGGQSEVFFRIVRTCPYIAAILDRMKIDFKYLSPREFVPNIKEKQYLEYVLSLCFTNMRGSYAPVVNEIRSSKMLLPEHFLIGSLQFPKNASYLDWIPDSNAARYYERKTYPNPIAQHIYDLAGIERWYYDDAPVERVDIETQQSKFAEEFITLLRGSLAFEPSRDSQQFILYWDNKRFRLRPFGMWDTVQLQDSPLPDGSIWIARSNVLEPLTRFTDSAIEELEHLINTRAQESQFQDFFEKHPEFLLTLDNYRGIHPQLILHEDDGTSLIPDFFLEKINSDFCDICDLKQPTAELMRNQARRMRFRDIVMEGIAQLETYRDWFEDKAHRSEFLRRYGLISYRPKVILVIGRRLSYYDDVERVRLESRLPNYVVLKTYDDILEKAILWRSLFKIRK